MDAATLHCIICPTLPQFSDVSHLLTHVASKAHLSHYFNLQVRTIQDPAAAELLNEYNEWYSGNDLAQLLSDRMTSKDDRKKKRKSKAEKGEAKIPQRKKPRRSSKSSQAVPDFLDPRLMVPGPTKEPQAIDESSCPVTPSVFTAEDRPSSQLQAGATSATCTAASGPDNQHGHTHGQGSFPITTIPKTPQPHRNKRIVGELSLDLKNASEPLLDSTFPTNTSDEFDYKVGPDEMARLKGIIWPGMDLFDSATQQMRRKRNQKKDCEVLKKMEQSSLQIEPTEFVFLSHWERLIDGNADNDSPLKGETPIPKSRTHPKKNALQKSLDPNIMWPQDRKGSKGVTTRSRKHSATSDATHNGCSLPTGGLTGLQRPLVENNDFALSVQAFGKRPRQAFSVFTDESASIPPSLANQALLSKIQRDTLTLTPARLVLDRASDDNEQARKTDQEGVDKENMEPILNSQGRIDYPWSSPSPRRLQQAIPYYYDELPGIGYRASNPLLAPGHKMDSYECNPYGEATLVANNEWAVTPTALSSEATLPDEERQQHDLALYLVGE
ncbi:hypothetical protein N7468_002274 [Penicillium chermesinum]|uniref:Uncharacterized protein n=1 Tax=Penicillium chermesinum TaxID=63820 RepID=A0A9W9PI75_9EURO|nr:uncharacterized protein N7468_002274 [Penicillium chermesinum]KAJ5247291.1 hypothetical protein N7468_002274 [Penicillium chermesinum]